MNCICGELEAVKKYGHKENCPMADDMTKRRDDLAEEICISPEFNTEDLFISEVLEMNRIWGFKEGFDAGVAEMQAQIARLEKAVQYSKNCFYSFGADEHLKELELILEGR